MKPIKISSSTATNAMKDKIFVDSNIWIYLFTSDDASKNECARDFITNNTAKENILVISYQVINEVGAVLKTKKKKQDLVNQFLDFAKSNYVTDKDFKFNRDECYERQNIC